MARKICYCPPQPRPLCERGVCVKDLNFLREGSVLRRGTFKRLFWAFTFMIVMSAWLYSLGVHSFRVIEWLKG